MKSFLQNYKIKTVKSKIAILIILITIITLFFWFIEYNNSSNSTRLAIAQSIGLTHATELKNKIKNELESSLHAAESLTKILSSVKNINDHPKLERQQVNSILRNFLASNKNFTAIGIFWEPNGFDNMDISYKNKDIYGRTGNFAAYWYKSGQGRIDNTPYLEGYISNFYTTPKKTKRPMIIPPHNFHAKGKDILVTTIVHPILYNAKFYGIITIDVLTKSLEQIIELATIYNGKSRMSIIANDGTIVASTSHPDLAGEPLKELYLNHEEQIVEIIRARQKIEFTEDGELQIFLPISFSNTNTPWQYRVEVPKNEVFKEQPETVSGFFYILAGIVITLLLLTISIVNYYLRPLGKVALIAEKLGKGDVKVDSDFTVTGQEFSKIHHTYNGLINSFRHVSSFAYEIGKGNLDIDFKPLGPNDVLGNSLLEMRNSLQDARKLDESRKIEDQKRNWSTEGLAMFNEILRRQSDNIETLAYNIMEGLVDYLKANQGALFIYNDDDKDEPFLELIVAIAYNERRFMNKIIKPGEGILGTCAIEKQTIYMSKVPENYIQITSGMGEATPRYLLIVPLVINEQIFGIVELASFRDFLNHEIEFVQKLAESIASTISVTKVNVRTNKLLELSKKQSEELAAQEEEMRQNLEELEATQEEMHKKEKLMKELALEMRMQEENLKDKLEKYTKK